jgi:mutator protein MutT
MATSKSHELQQIGIAVVEHARHFLVGIRPGKGPLAGYHEFPGGKCGPGETPAACAIRETLEETGLRIRITEPLYECRFEYPHRVVRLHFFLCRPEPGERITDNHSGFEWVDAHQLSELMFPPANEPVILKLLNRQRGYSSGDGDIG